MNPAPNDFLRPHLELLRCPSCRADLGLGGEALTCSGCARSFPISDGIPQLFWPHDRDPQRRDVTEIVKAFYEETPFPNYDDFDNVATLAQKAREGIFARMLDEQMPPSVRVIECGCGTGQLSNFLSIANRTVFGTDMCENSLRLGQSFARRHGLSNVNFVQMNLFRTAFKPGSFHFVISNGVLHHTSDPKRGFLEIADLVMPGGYILVGLYHRYGRLITDFRRLLFNISGDRFKSLDPNLRRRGMSAAKKRAWFADQYKSPWESKHTIGEAMGWLREAGFQFVKSIPRGRPFQPITARDRLLEAEAPGNAFERLLVELGMTLRGSREGGFFIIIGRKT